MKKTTALWTLTLLISISSGVTAGEHANHFGPFTNPTLVAHMEAPAQATTPPAAPAAKTPSWKSRDEYDAYNAMATATDPSKKIELAEAFLKKYPTSDFKSGAYMTEMQVYYQLGKSDQALDAAKKVLGVDPDNLDALAFLSYVFPFTFSLPQWQATHVYDSKGMVIQAATAGGAHVQTLTKTGTSGSTGPKFSSTGELVCENGGTSPCWQDSGALDSYNGSRLSRADSDAHHALDVLTKLQKPANIKDADFKIYVSAKRGIFNTCIGFVALQNKNYTAAITALKAGEADNPSDVYDFYRLGLAYLYSNPADYDNALWYMARAVALANAAKPPNPAGEEISKFLKSAYVNYHGTDTGLTDLQTQAASQPDPPAGFKVTKAEAPKPTGNQMVDAFNTLTYPLKLGGETAQKQWDGVKGQPLQLGGTVTSVEKGEDPKESLVRIAILDSTKSADGYDIELKDSTQPNVKNLQKGDLITYKGTLDTYVATPNLILTLVGEVTSELPDKPPVKEKPKPPAHHTPVHKTTPPSN